MKADDTRVKRIVEEALGAAADAGRAAALDVLKRRLAEDALPVRTPGRFGAKRTRADLASTADAAHVVISAHPGIITERIAAALKVKSADLTLPLRRLVAAGRVRRAGAGRFSRYEVITPGATS